MRLLFSTNEFTYAGVPRPGIPIILGKDMRPVEPFQSFLLWLLLRRGSILSPITWEDYGRRLWDFCSFLSANNLSWDAPATDDYPSVVYRYREWSIREVKCSRKTVNQRLRIVARFYEWATKRELIPCLPYGFRDYRMRPNHFLAHTDLPRRSNQAADLHLTEWVLPPEFLSTPQIIQCRTARMSSAARIVFELMTSCGLRSCEARTFPLKYVFNPETRPDCRPDRLIRVKLDERDMWIKFSKSRWVDIPYSMMQDCHAYTIYERNAQLARRRGSEASQILALSRDGTPFTKSGLSDLFKRLSNQVGFRVRPLMLRHSFAVHTLSRLRRDPNYQGEPLLYVRDRLGHSDVQTTLIYLRQLDQLSSALVVALEDELDQLYRHPQFQAE